MNRLIGTITVLTVALSTATYAGSVSSAPSATASSSATMSTPSTDHNPGVRPARYASADPNRPGATGRTIVSGDSSTINGDRTATTMQQTGAISGGD
jgi:hypothetical protein